MRVFITGGSGFIGSAVVRRLADAGHQPVCLLRRTSRLHRLEGLAIERVEGDVRDATPWRDAMARCDATLHLAAPASWDADDPSLMRAVIEDGARNVLDIATELPGHRVVVVSSSTAIDGSDTPRLFDERSEFTLRDPALVYAHAKHRAELYVAKAVARGAQVVIVNPAEVYGPGDTELATAGSLVGFLTATPVLVCSGGTSVVHVDDVARGILAALALGRCGERYILGGENLTVRELAALTLSLSGRRARVVPINNRLVRSVARAARALRIPLPFNPHVVPYATRYWFMDSAKATRELGVSFRGARETIGATIDWLITERHIVRAGRSPHSAFSRPRD